MIRGGLVRRTRLPAPGTGAGIGLAAASALVLLVGCSPDSKPVGEPKTVLSTAPASPNGADVTADRTDGTPTVTPGGPSATPTSDGGTGFPTPGTTSATGSRMVAGGRPSGGGRLAVAGSQPTSRPRRPEARPAGPPPMVPFDARPRAVNPEGGPPIRNPPVPTFTAGPAAASVQAATSVPTATRVQATPSP